MASIIPGYNYDIFISYRQNDNKYDGWVTEFVDNLNKELEANIKDKISVYFDINPHDGLLETHSVDQSLEDKLKCLIFIPIISRTYCDTKSFAWQHEFVAFNKLTKEDEFGRYIRLANGNVASRILPVKIHDLDSEDNTLLEKELEGTLRSIEFIYKEPGVNRPLKSDDDEKSNLNKTKYRNQINKVANAIKEIITAIEQYNPESEEVQKKGLKPLSIPRKSSKTKILAWSIIAIALIILGLFLIPKLFKSEEQIEKSIAVLPFRNLSNDTTQLYFCDGFMEEILNNLQEVKRFTVRSRTSSDQYRDTKKSISTIGNELNANYLVEGSVGREGNKLKIWVQLIDSKADKHIWSHDYTKEMTQIFTLQSEIAKNIATELKAILSTNEIEKIEKNPTKSLEAYNYYLQGNYYYWKGNSLQDAKTAINLYEKAVDLDPGFALAYARIANCYLSQYWIFTNRNEDIIYKCKQAIDKAFEIDPDLPEAHLALGYYYYWGFLNYPQALEQCEKVLKEQPGNSESYFLSASIYRRAGEWELSKKYYEKAFELNPRSAQYALNTAETCDLLRDYSQAQYYYPLANMLEPDWIEPYVYHSRMYLKSEGDTKMARELLGRAIHDNESFISDSILTEINIIIKIYDGKYQEAMKDLSLYKSDVFQMQFYYKPKYLYYAIIYGLMNLHEMERKYCDSARIFLEKKIIAMPEDPRLFSSLGVAYAGLGEKEKAIYTGEKAVELMPVNKEAYRGAYRLEDLAKIYVMVGENKAALEQIEYLLSIPSPLSVKLLLLDQIWKPLWDSSDFKKIINKFN